MGSVEQNLKIAGLTLHEISQRSGISVGYLSLIFSGKRTNISLSILTRLGFVLNLSITDVKLLIHELSERPQQVRKPPHNKAVSLKDKAFKENDKHLQDLIHRTIQSLEKFDPQMLNLLKQEAVESLAEVPLRDKFVEWIEGIMAARNNEFDQAFEHLMRARTFKSTKIYEKRMLAKIYGGLGSCLTALGDYKTAFKMFTKSLNIWGKGPDAGLIYLNMGTLYRRCRKYNYASQSYKQAVELGSGFVQMMAYSGLGQVYIDQKDLANARVILLKGYTVSRQQQETWGVPELYCNLGIVYKLSNMYSLAKVILSKGKRLAEGLGAVRVKHYILLELEEVLLLLKQEAEAQAVLAQLENELVDKGDLILLGRMLLSSAQNLWNSSRELALGCLLKSYRTLNQLGPSHDMIKCCRMLAEYYINKGTPELRYFYLDEVKRIRKLLTDKVG